MTHSATIRLENPSKEPIRVWFEPWGDFRDLESGQHFDLEFLSDVRGAPELKANEGTIVVYAWPTATLTVRSACSEVVKFIVPVPTVPAGTNVSSFLEVILGKSADDKKEI